jgi:Tol biopolymer transport system component/metal-dependent hydrolase (beta-lactamase superfamily II)
MINTAIPILIALLVFSYNSQNNKNNGKIAFYSLRNDKDEIYVVNIGDNKTKYLTDGQCPAFSPDGSQIAFQKNSGTNKDIYVINLDGSDFKRLTNSPSCERHAAWSPDGRKIAFQSDRDGNPEIYIMDADGSNWHRSTNNPADEMRPSWSPDGKQIAFNSDRDGNWEIYIKNIDGTKERRLTHTAHWELFPAWSPDGTKIAFRSGRAKVFEGDIHTINIDGTGEHQLTHDEGMEEDPAWSTDGKYVAFQSMKEGNMEIYVMSSDGGEWRNITNHSGHDYWPTWLPSETKTQPYNQQNVTLSPNNVKLQILFDNNPYVEGLETDPGFACLITINNKALLFDAGRIGSKLMSNIETLEIDPAIIEQIVISHNHSDHMCGLPALLKECNKPKVFIVEAMANNVSEYAQELIDESISSAEEHASKVIRTCESEMICNNVFTTGVLGSRIPEQALIIQTNAGLIVIIGCGHPGVAELTRKAKELLERDVLLVIGGFHLMGKKPEEIQEVATSLSKLTSYIAPCHCSGDIARELFKEEFGKNYIEVGVGRIVNIGELMEE